MTTGSSGEPDVALPGILGHRASSVRFERPPAAAIGSQLQSIEKKRQQQDDDEGGDGQAERGDKLIEEAQSVTCGDSPGHTASPPHCSGRGRNTVQPFSRYSPRLAGQPMGSNCGHVPTMHSAGTTAKASMRTTFMASINTTKVRGQRTFVKERSVERHCTRPRPILKVAEICSENQGNGGGKQTLYNKIGARARERGGASSRSRGRHLPVRGRRQPRERARNGREAVAKEFVRTAR